MKDIGLGWGFSYSLPATRSLLWCSYHPVPVGVIYRFGGGVEGGVWRAVFALGAMSSECPGKGRVLNRVCG
jgi:hypothetical protein